MGGNRLQFGFPQYNIFIGFWKSQEFLLYVFFPFLGTNQCEEGKEEKSSYIYLSRVPWHLNNFKQSWDTINRTQILLNTQGRKQNVHIHNYNYEQMKESLISHNKVQNSCTFICVTFLHFIIIYLDTYHLTRTFKIYLSCHQKDSNKIYGIVRSSLLTDTLFWFLMFVSSFFSFFFLVDCVTIVITTVAIIYINRFGNNQWWRSTMVRNDTFWTWNVYYAWYDEDETS